MKSFTLKQITWGILFAQLFTGPAFAQYGGSTTPTYGAGKTVAVGAAAAGAGAGLLYLTLHHRGFLTGCVQGGGVAWRLVDDKNRQIFSLMPGGADLKSGQRLELRGKRTKGEKGTQAFEVSKIVKNLGACSTESLASLSNSR